MAAALPNAVVHLREPNGVTVPRSKVSRPRWKAPPHRSSCRLHRSVPSASPVGPHRARLTHPSTVHSGPARPSRPPASPSKYANLHARTCRCREKRSETSNSPSASACTTSPGSPPFAHAPPTTSPACVRPDSPRIPEQEAAHRLVARFSRTFVTPASPSTWQSVKRPLVAPPEKTRRVAGRAGDARRVRPKHEVDQRASGRLAHPQANPATSQPSVEVTTVVAKRYIATTTTCSRALG